jgi:RNA polymerase sigma-70 factor (ECF subfamily)
MYDILVIMDTYTEVGLIAQAKTDVHAFDALYEAYFDRIYLYCLRRLANRELAEDATSQTFLAAIEGIHKFDISKGGTFGAWLYRTANNKVIDVYRKHQRSLYINLAEIEIADTEAIDELDLSEMQKQIALVMNELKPKYREVISLKYFTELETEEIAEIMGLKPPTKVYVVLHRALQNFQRKFLRKFKKSEIFNLIPRYIQ